MDAQFFAILCSAVLLAGISKGGFGGGAAFVSSAILAIVVPPVIAVGIMLPLLMVMDVASAGAFWRKWDWPSAKVLILGGLPGIALGAYFMLSVNDDVMRLLIGGISVAFVVWSLWPKSTKAKPFTRAVGWFAGLVTGFTSTVSHAGGPPTAMYLLGLRLDKTTYHSTAVLVFWVINALKAVPYAALGFFTWETLRIDLMMIPVGLFGVFVGVCIHHIVSDRLFFWLTYALLMGAGCKLIWDALT